MASKYFGREFTLQRGETETVVHIAVQEELNQPVTEAANTVVENDRIEAGGGHMALLLMLRLRNAPDRSVRPTWLNQRPMPGLRFISGT